jgi:hypothetical protein
MFKYVYGTVETVNESSLFLVNNKGFLLKIPIKSIREIQTNKKIW